LYFLITSEDISFVSFVLSHIKVKKGGSRNEKRSNTQSNSKSSVRFFHAVQCITACGYAVYGDVSNAQRPGTAVDPCLTGARIYLDDVVGRQILLNRSNEVHCPGSLYLGSTKEGPYEQRLS